MKSYSEICQPIEAALAHVKEKVWQELGQVNDFAPEIGAYLQKMQGKYFRPTVVLLCAQMLGQDTAKSIILAQSVELLHLATLIHDDVLDNAKVRRNLETIHEKWGNRVAILVGDYLYSKTTQLLLQFQNFKILDHIASVTVGFTKGELLQLFNQKQVSVSKSDYFKVIELKTANFMAACAAFGGVLAAQHQEKLYQFGYHLGMAFQISDDLLDWVGNPGEAVKPVQHDLLNGIISLPLLLALEEASSDEQKTLQAYMDSQNSALVSFAEKIIAQHHGVLKTQKILDEHLAKAAQALKDLPAYQPLQNLLEYLSERVVQIPIPK